MSKEPKHILLASPPFFGHAIPLLELGRKLSQFHRITFAISESLLPKIQREFINPKHVHPINFIGVPETEIPIHADKFYAAYSSMDGLRKVLERIYPGMDAFFLQLRKTPASSKKEQNVIFVDAVVADNFLSGPVSILHDLGIPYYLMNSARVWLTHAILTLDIEEPEDFLPNKNQVSAFGYRSIGVKILDPNFEMNKQLLMPACTTAHLASGIIFNSFREAEKEAFADLIAARQMMREMPTFFVGPLFSETEKCKDEVIMNFLDNQNAGSVVFVSFGSVAVPTPEQTMEIGKGLLTLKAPVIWSLPADQHLYLPPEILQDRKEEFLILPWVPQREVLAHESVGVFVSHCGWNSTLESLTFGIPIVGWPMFADQLMNAEWLEQELGVGVFFRGTGMVADRFVPAEEIAETVEKVLKRSNGRNSFVDAAQKWKEKIQDALAPGGDSDVDFRNFALNL